jgi:hypothetical protein
MLAKKSLILGTWQHIHSLQIPNWINTFCQRKGFH